MHMKKKYFNYFTQDLSRRDDLFSFFFVILDLLNECLLWRTCNDDKVFDLLIKDEIKKKKEECLQDPENLLLMTTCKGKTELISILNYIKSLKYEDTPNYDYIRRLLMELKTKELRKQSNQVKFNWMNTVDPIGYIQHNTYNNDHSKVNLFNNFTGDSSLYVVNPHNSNNNLSTNFSTNSSLHYFLTLQQNSTNNSSTLNNINFKDNFTGLNNLYNRLNNTNYQDFSIKQPNLKKKRKRISLKEECIENENKEEYPNKKVIKQNIHSVRNREKEKDPNESMIYVNNKMVPAQNYFLFIENLKHLKKEEYIQQIPLYFPHNIGGIPGFSPFNINPSFFKPIDFPFTPPKVENVPGEKDGIPYYILYN